MYGARKSVYQERGERESDSRSLKFNKADFKTTLLSDVDLFMRMTSLHLGENLPDVMSLFNSPN
jgi:hypothetical protein